MRIPLLIALVALLAVAMPAFVLPLAGPARAAHIIFLNPPDPSNLPEGVAIASWSGRQAILSGVDARAARALYRLGAIVVYPLRSAGCITMS